MMGIKNPSLISRWENGFSLPDLENAFKLAAVYGVMVDTLFLDLKRSVQCFGIPGHKQCLTTPQHSQAED